MRAKKSGKTADVAEKTNEIPVAQALLACLPLKGRVCTADALHTHLPLWQLVRAQQAHPLLIVKENQPSLYETIALYFRDPHASCIQAETRDRHRGRQEHRQIRISVELTDYLSKEWPGIAQVAQILRTRRVKGETSVEMVFLITDLSPQQAPPLHLLHLTRGHWSIENCLHYVRDVTFREDASQISTGNAPALPGCLAQFGHYSSSSTRDFSDCCGQTLFLLPP
jgi:predicted transposase YbfD/YdcC